MFRQTRHAPQKELAIASNRRYSVNAGWLFKNGIAIHHVNEVSMNAITTNLSALPTAALSPDMLGILSELKTRTDKTALDSFDSKPETRVKARPGFKLQMQPLQ